GTGTVESDQFHRPTSEKLHRSGIEMKWIKLHPCPCPKDFASSATPWSARQRRRVHGQNLTLRLLCFTVARTCSGRKEPVACTRSLPTLRKALRRYRRRRAPANHVFGKPCAWSRCRRRAICAASSRCRGRYTRTSRTG